MCKLILGLVFFWLPACPGFLANKIVLHAAASDNLSHQSEG